MQEGGEHKSEQDKEEERKLVLAVCDVARS